MSGPPPAAHGAATAPGRAGAAQARAHAAALTPQALVARIGTVSPEHVAFGALLLASIPDELQQAAKEPYTARALALCLLLDGDRERAQAALARLGAADPGLAQGITRLLPAGAARGAGAHLPILDLCLPSLRQLSASQRVFFLELVARLQAGAGGGMGAYCIATLLRTRLADQPANAPGSGAIQSVQPLWPQLRVLLSALARAGVAAGADAPGGDEQEAVAASTVRPPAAWSRTGPATSRSARRRAGTPSSTPPSSPSTRPPPGSSGGSSPPAPGAWRPMAWSPSPRPSCCAWSAAAWAARCRPSPPRHEDGGWLVMIGRWWYDQPDPPAPRHPCTVPPWPSPPSSSPSPWPWHRRCRAPAPRTWSARGWSMAMPPGPP